MPQCGDQTPPSVPPLAKSRSSPTNTPVFPPHSFILLSSAWFCIFFSAGQVLLSTLSWWSECTSVSEGVFLMYLWRKMYSMSTYSSAILFSSSSFHEVSLKRTIKVCLVSSSKRFACGLEHADVPCWLPAWSGTVLRRAPRKHPVSCRCAQEKQSM